MNKNEFKFLGQNIENISIIYGIFLISWGLMISYISSSQSFTSLIPSVLGLPIFILSFFANIFTNKKKLLMHIVVIFGLIVFLGGLDFLSSLIEINNLLNNFWANISKLMMMITGFFFMLLCIKSFIFIRKNR